jgi:hypothetical protein
VPTAIKDGERAQDIATKRKHFETLSTSTSTLSNSTSRAPTQTNTHKLRTLHSQLILTKPVHGHTPGKASKKRAEERERFDRVVREKMEEKERERARLEREKQELEEEEDRERRKETVIWAKPVPAEIYGTRVSEKT